MMKRTKKLLRNIYENRERIRQVQEQGKQNGIPDDVMNDLILQMEIDQALEDAVPKEKQTTLDKSVKFRVWLKNKLSRNKNAEGKKEESNPDLEYIDRAISCKKDLLVEYEQELRRNPEDANVKRIINRNILELEENNINCKEI